jgi:hypothetical protein
MESGSFDSVKGVASESLRSGQDDRIMDSAGAKELGAGRLFAFGKMPGFMRRWNPTLTSKSATLGWGTRL